MFINIESDLEVVFSDIKHELHRAVHDKRHPFRYVSLASGKSDQIGLRYVVLRKVDEALNLIIYTDLRSVKVSEIQANPHVALLFYHPGKKLQIRLKGMAEIHHKDDLSHVHWNRQSEHGKKAYGSKLSPGTQVENPSRAHEWPETISDDYFAVIEIHPREIEALQLNNTEHLRILFMKESGQWKGNWLVP